MFKSLLLMSLLFSGTLLASPEDHVLSIKERIRISLWIEGIEDGKPVAQSKQVALPEEIERALKKM